MKMFSMFTAAFYKIGIVLARTFDECTEDSTKKIRAKLYSDALEILKKIDLIELDCDDDTSSNALLIAEYKNLR